ncbi:MAG: iron-sulfur cluster assembly protein, partial [Pseudomonadota bacterium]
MSDNDKVRGAGKDGARATGNDGPRAGTDDAARDASNDVARAAVEAALRDVELPDGQDLLGSGRVRSLVVEKGRVGLAIAAGRDEPEMEDVRQRAEAAAGAVPGVSRALAALVEDAAAPGGGDQSSAQSRPTA